MPLGMFGIGVMELLILLALPAALLLLGVLVYCVVLFVNRQTNGDIDDAD